LAGRIVLLSAEGVGTNAIMRETGKSKTCVWPWQERFAAEGVEGLLHDKTRPSRIPRLDPAIAERVVALTMEEPTREETGSEVVIPPKRNRIIKRRYDTDLYKERNIIERFFNKLKQFRRVATRYDKLLANFMGFVKLAAIAIWLK
jgi:hypothetical protein